MKSQDEKKSGLGQLEAGSSMFNFVGEARSLEVILAFNALAE